MAKISLIIADDHRLVRAGIKLSLSTSDEIEMVAEAEDGEELINLVDKFEPDVILLDGSMPKMDGITALKKILDKFPDTGIIMLTINEDTSFIQQCVDAGALSHLLKNVGQDELIATIKKLPLGNLLLTQ